jgi:Leucine-rich repeat (LRR) protein
VLNFNPIDNRIEHRPLRGLETVLEELQLGACRLRLLPSSLLSGMDKLERLHLWGNQIQQFPVGFFRQASNLRELLLWDNEIAVLNGDTLAGLWNLRRLDLDKNKIDELRKEAFRHLPELESLRLANNKIQVRCDIMVMIIAFSHETGNRNSRCISRAYNNAERDQWSPTAGGGTSAGVS